MDAVEHIDKATEALADMVEDGHLMHEDNFELSNCITAAQFELQEAKRIATENTEKGQS